MSSTYKRKLCVHHLKMSFQSEHNLSYMYIHINKYRYCKNAHFFANEIENRCRATERRRSERQRPNDESVVALGQKTGRKGKKCDKDVNDNENKE